MAIVEVKVPQLSESVAEATLLQWKKKPGDAVAIDEVLIEVETDKVVLEVPASSAGVLAQIVKTDGSTVVSGELIATIDSEAKAAVAVAPTPAPAAAPAQRATPAASGGGIAMPAAAKMLADAGMSAVQVAGTGKDGRILKGDVIAAKEGVKPAAPPAPALAPSRPALPEVRAQLDLSALADRPEQRVPMSRLRQRVAERLVQSQSTAAILTTFNEVNMQPVMELRNRYKDKFEKEHSVKLGFMSFFVKAAIAAL
jgi:2-oxoglutarate dehydrogenase E2 component (dihydrolipoamide succinyltransferase)